MIHIDAKYVPVPMSMNEYSFKAIFVIYVLNLVN
jgi:hypothetical protein